MVQCALCPANLDTSTTLRCASANCRQPLCAKCHAACLECGVCCEFYTGGCLHGCGLQLAFGKHRKQTKQGQITAYNNTQKN